MRLFSKTPSVFKPQRWIDNPGLPEPAMFGHERRVCPGRHSAGSATFVEIASMLWGYNLDVKGGVTEVPVNRTSFAHLPDSSGVLFSCRNASIKRSLKGSGMQWTRMSVVFPMRSVRVWVSR